MVTFYALDNNGKPTHPVLFLDTLKVSTIEQTAENTEARGGKGNASLIMWDYNKEITVTLEDALFSAKSMAIMFGNGAGAALSSYLMRTMEVVAPVAEEKWIDNEGKKHDMIHAKYYTAEGSAVASTALATGVRYFCTYDVQASSSHQIDISASTFPGTYYVVGDTYARSQESGQGEFFQFVIPKARVSSENTITPEAEGDPSVFNMNLTVLRPADGIMMKLIKYDVAEGAGEASISELIHNHDLKEPAVG